MMYSLSSCWNFQIGNISECWNWFDLHELTWFPNIICCWVFLLVSLSVFARFAEFQEIWCVFFSSGQTQKYPEQISVWKIDTSNFVTVMTHTVQHVRCIKKRKLTQSERWRQFNISKIISWTSKFNSERASNAKRAIYTKERHIKHQN